MDRARPHSTGGRPPLGAAPLPATMALGATAPQSGSWFLVRRYWPLYGLVFLIGTENFILSPFLPAMALEFGAPVTALALAVTAYSIAYALSAPLLGSISDRLAPGRLIAYGAALFVAGNFLVGVAGSIGFLEVSRAVTGIAGAMAGPSIWAYIAGDVAPGARGQAIGLGMAAFSLGQVIGIPVGGAVAVVADWRAALVGIGVVMVPLAVAAWRMPRLAARPPASPHHWLGVLDVWKSGVVAHALAVNLAFQAANLACYTYLGALLSERHGLATAELAAMGILVGAGSFLGAFVGGRLNDRLRQAGAKGAQLQVLWACLLAGSIALATATVPLGLAAAGIVCWFFASGAFVTTQTAMITLFAPTLRASAVSWNNSLMHAGAALGVWSIGGLAPLGVTMGAAGVSWALLAALLAAWLIRGETAQLKQVAS